MKAHSNIPEEDKPIKAELGPPPMPKGIKMNPVASASITVLCPSCSHRYLVARNDAGQYVKCDRCGVSFQAKTRPASMDSTGQA
jgi:predicted Zn finger-like uncharacterized protein